MPKKTFFNPAQRRCSDAVIYILGYSDAIKLQRRSSAAVKELVLRCWVYWPNRLGWRQTVLQPPSMFMLLSWWCPLGHGKRHLPAIQIFIVVRLIPILTHLSSRWTVPLSYKKNLSATYAPKETICVKIFWWYQIFLKNTVHLFSQKLLRKYFFYLKVFAKIRQEKMLGKICCFGKKI